MDYRNILATGFLLLCGAVFVHSLKSANAFPQGPNVSMGSNPVFAFDEWGNSGTLFTNTHSGPAIVTDLSFGGSSLCTAVFYVTNSGDSFTYQTRYDTLYVVNLRSGIQVPPGESLKYSATNSHGSNTDCTFASVSGYYAH